MCERCGAKDGFDVCDACSFMESCRPKQCPECAKRGPGYCPVCKMTKVIVNRCGDCGKNMSDEETGQKICELCSMYPSSR